MKRRTILLGSAAALTLPTAGVLRAAAQTATADPSRLGADLTPLGAEMAASASGHVPAWTGGVTTLPSGYTADMYPPDLFAGETPSFTVNADNVAQYSDMLPDGQVQLLKRYGSTGYKINVYPTHRTAAAPQRIYDAAKVNVTNTKVSSGGIEYGFSNAKAGPPFPILSSDPALAGAQCMWNHLCRWQGVNTTTSSTEWVIGSGQAVLSTAEYYIYWSPYNDPNVSLADFDANPLYSVQYVTHVAPPNQVGGKVMGRYSSNLATTPDSAYEYLVGEGRIRQLPGAEYDIPAPAFGDALNYDEVYLWSGALDRYTWQLTGKKEIIVPYNNISLLYATPADTFTNNTFMNADLTRYEIHRCWVVEAHLAPGKRHSEPHRRFYLDEDTWTVLYSEAYDDQGNYWKIGLNLLETFPGLPGNVLVGYLVYNLQAGNLAFGAPFYKAHSPLGSPPADFGPIAQSKFNPQAMANSGEL